MDMSWIGLDEVAMVVGPESEIEEELRQHRIKNKRARNKDRCVRGREERVGGWEWSFAPRLPSLLFFSSHAWSTGEPVVRCGWLSTNLPAISMPSRLSKRSVSTAFRCVSSPLDHFDPVLLVNLVPFFFVFLYYPFNLYVNFLFSLSIFSIFIFLIPPLLPVCLFVLLFLFLFRSLCLSALFLFFLALALSSFFGGMGHSVSSLDKQGAMGNEQLLQEVEILRRLDHPTIVAIVEIFDTPETLSIVLELAQGGELFDRIVDKTKFTEDETKFFFRQLFLAVSYLHSQGVAHRDLKPENILLSSRDMNAVIKVMSCSQASVFMSSAFPLLPCCHFFFNFWLHRAFALS